MNPINSMSPMNPINSTNSTNSSNPINSKNYSYVVITPVRNEAKYLRFTIDSMVRQTVLPKEWIIVDDGSTDETPQIIDEAARRYPWIKAVHRADRGFRKSGGGVIEAFYEGYAALSSSDWEFIVKLDGDLSFQPTHFDSLLKEFLKNPKLGIASGTYLERNSNGSWNVVEMPYYHAAGACKVLRYNCFEEIKGFIIQPGWDTIDEIRAMARGWITGHFPDIQMMHHKFEGTGIGVLKTSLMHGRIYYRTGGNLLFFALKVLRRILVKPYVLNAVALLTGYLMAMLRRETALVNNRKKNFITGSYMED